MRICVILVFLISYTNLFGQRNTVLIIADDLSPDYFGFYENHVDTVDVPNIRSLLVRGIRFKNLMSNPVCSSTRTTILTGRYSFRTGVGGIVGGTGGSNQIDTAEISIPKLLRTFNANIAKADIGKWHLKQPAPVANLMSPIALGYNHFEGPFIGQLPSYTNWTKFTNGVSSSVTTYATTENVNNAVTWLKTLNPSNPFFLWLAFNAPHEPLHLPPAGLHSYTNLNGTNGNINAQPKEYFKAMIQAMDHEIGRLFDSLATLNRLDSTDFVFIGDNGNTPRTAQIADLTKAKGTVYQYGVHVPCIISGPSVVSPNRVSNALINTADLFATIVENFGYVNWQSQIPTNKPVDSKSLKPIIRNLTDSIRPWSFCEIFKLITDSADGKAIRNKDYKLIKFDYGVEEFYNLTADANEATNLLNGVLTSTDLSNYNYLCTELSTLLGISSCSSSVHIQESEPSTFSISNPVYDKITLPKNILVGSAFSIFDIEGRKVFSSIIPLSEPPIINVSNIISGVYFLQFVSMNNEIITLKIMKQ
jgi:arylsulfatase A-like enzyme